MPDAPLRPCLRWGCGELVAHGCCDAHRGMLKDDRRPSHSLRGYDRTWYRLRAAKLSREPLCEAAEICKDHPIIRRVATQVDHVIPIRLRPDLRLVWSNLQSLCASCHSAKTRREQVAGRRGGGPGLSLDTGGRVRKSVV